MHIRTATISDAGAIAAIYNDAIEKTVSSFWYEPRPVEETIEEIRAGGERYPWLVAEDAPGALAGYAHCKPWNKRDGYRHTVETTIYIAERCRGRGIGRMLYDDLFARIRVLGYRHVIAGISLPNPASERLHEAMGMQRVATFENVGEKFGREISVGYWQVSLPVSGSEAAGQPNQRL